MAELISAQLKDGFGSDECRHLNEWDGMSFELDKHELLVRTATPHRPIMALYALRKRDVLLEHYPTLKGHPKGHKLYAKIRCRFYWAALVTDCYMTVSNCPNCARKCLRLNRTVGKHTLFPANAPLESECIDILVGLIRTAREIRYLLFIFDRFTALVHVVSLKGVSESEVTHWVLPYSPLTDLIDDNRN